MGAEAVWTSELGFYDERFSNVVVREEKAQNFFKHDYGIWEWTPEIKLFEILIRMEKGDKRIDLEHVEFESIRSIKDKFEEISSMLP